MGRKGVALIEILVSLDVSRLVDEYNKTIPGNVPRKIYLGIMEAIWVGRASRDNHDL